jgi:exonuclease VII large subunit
MSRATSTTNETSLTGLSGLTGFSRKPLTPEQQMQALKRVQGQAEQRVKLGMQLFKAAEARLSSQTDVLQQIKTLQKQLREQVNQDVAQSLHSYDQWIGQIDESFTTAIRKLEEKIDAVQANLVTNEGRMQNMLDRAEAMLDQSRCLMEQNSLKAPAALPEVKPMPPAKPTPISTFTPPIIPPETPAVSIPPDTNAQTDLSSASPKQLDDEDKIYSKLLQRLIDDAPKADTDSEADGNDASGTPSDDDDKNQADAA